MALDAAENYFSLDDILATNEKIPCKVELPIYRLDVRVTVSSKIPPLPLPMGRLEDYMNTEVSIYHTSTVVKDNGYLDSSSINEHLVPGTKVEMPFWMARALCSRKRHIVSVDTPKNYKDSYREILTADANVVDLHKLGPYYYCFGTHLLKFEQPESADIAKSLVKTFQTRFRKVMDSSQNSYNEDTSKLTQKLDESERLLFKAGQLGLNDFMRWETRETEKLSTSEMVRNHRKRKRAALDEAS